MEESHLGSSNKRKSTKVEEMIKSKSKSKTSSFYYFKKLFNLLTCFGNIFISLFNKISLLFSKCPILVQFSLFLIPNSIAMIIAIFFIHFNFYSNLYAFNFSKALKEEFFDLYITTIDDLKTEMTAIVVQETKLDLENQLFFQIYFKELSLAGLMDKDKNFLKNFDDNEFSYSLYSNFNKIENVDVNFTIEPDIASEIIDNRNDDKLGNFAKLYYYMFPHFWFEDYKMKSIINQSFFIAYEFMSYRGFKNDPIFFRFPKNSDGFKIKNNFVPNNFLLNPQVESIFEEEFLIFMKYDNFFKDLNWFSPFDYEFRTKINIRDLDLLTNISLAHLNLENDGNINKTFISYSQQYIKYKNRYFIINIIFFVGQSDLKESDNDYTFFIVKDNFSNILSEEDNTLRYSNNISYVISHSDMTEYSIADKDFHFFHLGLYDNNYNFYMNGILYDNFNLDYFYDYSKFYSSPKEGEYDLKYFVALYLYKSLFQNVKYNKIKKNREEIFLYNFKEENKVKQICEKINFNSYKDYLKNANIDCWEKRNQIHYNTEKFLSVTMDNDSNTIDPIYPYCSCLPLYCLKNYENLDENLDNLEIAGEINLPNKCQNKFMNYEYPNLDAQYTGYNKILEILNISLDLINYDYVKIHTLNLNQLPGYFFLMISNIQTEGETYIHSYYKLITKIEIIVLVLGVLIIASIINVIIIYRNMKKYSLVISNFEKKFEFFVFHSENESEFNSYKNNNLNKIIRIKENKKLEEQLINNDDMQIWETDSLISKDFFNINDNNLLDDLFSIFSETYNITRKDLEDFYSLQNHKSKNQMKVEMMQEKNELFELLSIFCLHAPFFQLNLNFDYNMYEYSEIMKKYNRYVRQLKNIDIEKTRLTQNILYELISTECIADYGLITNFDFKYITNIKSDSQKNSIKYTIFQNIKNIQKKRNKNLNEGNKNEEIDVKKLVLIRKNVLTNNFRNNFESDDFLNYIKLDSAFNFFLINSYYKYFRQIALEDIIS